MISTRLSRGRKHFPWEHEPESKSRILVSETINRTVLI